jgi:hypothetical protein
VFAAATHALKHNFKVGSTHTLGLLLLLLLLLHA